MAGFRRRGRRQFGRKRTFRRNFKRKTMKKQMLKPTMGGKLRQPIHYFTRYVSGSTFDITMVNATTATYGVVYFDLTMVPNYAEFTAMYDFFKIKAVKVSFIPITNVSIGYQLSGSTSTTEPVPYSLYSNRLFTCIDYNDRTVPASIDAIRQYSNCKYSPGGVIHKRFIYPKPIVAMDEDSSVSNSYGFGQSGSPWISTGSNNCEYYGIKFAYGHVDPGATVVAYKVEMKFYLAFKGRN